MVCYLICCCRRIFPRLSIISTTFYCYDPKAKCPNILKFLGQVLQPQDVFTAMQIIGYCLYRDNKYEKAITLAGPGGNGKEVFIRLEKKQRAYILTIIYSVPIK